MSWKKGYKIQCTQVYSGKVAERVQIYSVICCSAVVIQKLIIGEYVICYSRIVLCQQNVPNVVSKEVSDNMVSYIVCFDVLYGCTNIIDLPRVYVGLAIRLSSYL